MERKGIIGNVMRYTELKEVERQEERMNRFSYSFSIFTETKGHRTKQERYAIARME